MGRAMLLLVLLGCGGPPLGQRVPRADPKVVAGIAAAAAAAATLADPSSAGRPEQPENVAEKRTVRGETMPGDMLDRLDGAEADAGLGPR
jgi:hypothetical protein